jgi:hypothetical protein
MDTKVDPLGVEPGEEGRVALQLPEWLGCIDMDVKAERHCVVFGQHSTVVGADASNILNVITGRDVRFFGKGNAIHRSGENVVGVGLLKMLKEFVEECLDGIRRSIGDRVNDFDTEERYVVLPSVISRRVMNGLKPGVGVGGGALVPALVPSSSAVSLVVIGGLVYIGTSMLGM